MQFAEKKHAVILIAVLIAVITYLHYSTVEEAHEYHDIYREFYYIPVLFGALVFGLKGALLAYASISILYLPYLLMTWTDQMTTEANKLLHLLLQGFFAVFSGMLIDRDRRHRNQLDKERYLAGLGQATAVIVHDIRNYLITILGFTKRIQEGKGEGETALRAIRESALTMQGIVHDVLDFSMPIHLKPTLEDFRDTVRRACDSCKAKAQEQGVALTVELTRETLPTQVDAVHLERAIVNLINNAIDASDKDQEVNISVSPDKDHLVIRIKDHGSGMDKETLDNIFIPFYTKKSSGTGLGMPIAKKIVEGHQGRIHILSRPGQGTEITIEIPQSPKKRESWNS
ncbi:MAG: HAMP domain-containing sensor histidine kinase [Thermodesulfovibrionales bacterium]|nr:HAMP domain-containing sensor histidine kinase [Thermodesulfovibrionales bacterium]